jgi:hypothetical protein
VTGNQCLLYKDFNTNHATYSLLQLSIIFPILLWVFFIYFVNLSLFDSRHCTEMNFLFSCCHFQLKNLKKLTLKTTLFQKWKTTNYFEDENDSFHWPTQNKCWTVASIPLQSWIANLEMYLEVSFGHLKRPRYDKHFWGRNINYPRLF